MAMQAPVVASIQQAPNGFVQHWVMPVIYIPPWDSHAYCQASQAVEFGDRVWIGDPKNHAAQWQRSGCVAADGQFSCPPSSGHVPTSHDSSLSHTLNSTGSPRQRHPSMLEPHLSPGHRPDALACGQPADAESHVSVVLSGLPTMLCSAKCFEAAVEQACHESDVVTFEVKITGGVGDAVLILRTESAAQRCIRHFTGLRCARSSPILARYNADAGKRLMARRNGAHSVRDEPPSQEPKACQAAANLHRKTRQLSASKPQSAMEFGTNTRCKTEGEVAATGRSRELVTCEEIAPTAASPKDMVVARPPVARCSLTSSDIDSPMKSKKLWADYDDDVDDDEDGFYWDQQSTLAPPDSESSAFWSSDNETS